jgi:hypothetical protein
MGAQKAQRERQHQTEHDFERYISHSLWQGFTPAMFAWR